MSGAYVYTPVERASRRLGLLLLFIVGVILMIGLYYVKMRAQTAREDVVRLEMQIKSEQAAIDVLLAERALLASPDRLAALSAERLGLEPVSVEQTLSLKDLSDREARDE